MVIIIIISTTIRIDHPPGTVLRSYAQRKLSSQSLHESHERTIVIPIVRQENPGNAKLGKVLHEVGMRSTGEQALPSHPVMYMLCRVTAVMYMLCRVTTVMYMLCRVTAEMYKVYRVTTVM